MKLPAARPQGIFSPNVFLLLIAAFHPRGKTTGYSSGFEIKKTRIHPQGLCFKQILMKKNKREKSVLRVDVLKLL